MSKIVIDLVMRTLDIVRVSGVDGARLFVGKDKTLPPGCLGVLEEELFRQEVKISVRKFCTVSSGVWRLNCIYDGETYAALDGSIASKKEVHVACPYG